MVQSKPLYQYEFFFLQVIFLWIISENERELEATNSSLRKQLKELQGKLENSQLQEESEIARSCLSQKICELNHQLAACKSELAKDATEKKCIKAEVEDFKGNFKYTVVNLSIT